MTVMVIQRWLERTMSHDGRIDITHVALKTPIPVYDRYAGRAADGALRLSPVDGVEVGPEIVVFRTKQTTLPSGRSHVWLYLNGGTGAGHRPRAEESERVAQLLRRAGFPRKGPCQVVLHFDLRGIRIQRRDARS